MSISKNKNSYNIIMNGYYKDTEKFFFNSPFTYTSDKYASILGHHKSKPKPVPTVISLTSLSGGSDLDEDEFKVQKALGTLPVSKFTITQPIRLEIMLDLVAEVSATDEKTAIEAFEKKLKSTIALTELVSKILHDMTSSYKNYISENDVTIPRAVAHGKKKLNHDDILIIKVREK